MIEVLEDMDTYEITIISWLAHNEWKEFFVK